MSDTIKALTETVRGRVIVASDPDYDDARADYSAAENYGANYGRLSAVKAVYDADNIVYVNENIAPANGR